jgi:hypothetical protein
VNPGETLALFFISVSPFLAWAFLVARYDGVILPEALTVDNSRGLKFVLNLHESDI